MKGLFGVCLVLLLAVALYPASAELKSKNTLADSLNEDVGAAKSKPSQSKTKCPRNCICTPSSRSTIARCNRLELGVQRFGDEISDLIVEKSRVPIALTDSIFKKLGLNRVINVKITQSTITQLSPMAFNGLDDLYSVNLTSTNIQKLDPQTFAANNMLNLLSLSGNPLKMSAPFLKSSSLQELDLSACNLKTIPKKAFDQLKSLMYINLSKNQLQSLDSNVFANLPALEEINLTHNNLARLPKNLFANNPEMSSLYLDNNPLTSVSGLQITDLINLNLIRTSIRVIKNNTFDGVPNLSSLSLNGNGIEEIESGAFANFSEMTYLDLSNNKLSALSESLIMNSSYLDVFKIANNTNLRALPKNGFAVNDIDFNIYLFDASGCSIEVLSNDTFNNMFSLTQVDLSRNRITSVEFAFDKLKLLIDLDLSHNLIEILDKNTFANNKDLTKLNLSGNPLVLISLELFVNNPSIRWLDISNCQLYKMWESTENMSSNVLSNLKYLAASKNQFSNIHYEELQNFNKLETLDISKNPLQCNVIFERLMKWLGEQNISPFLKETVVSNMDTEEKSVANKLNWEMLAKDVCGEKTDASSSTPKSKIETAADILKKIRKNPIKDNQGDYIVDEDEDDDDDIDDTDDEDDEDDDDDDEDEEESTDKKEDVEDGEGFDVKDDYYEDDDEWDETTEKSVKKLNRKNATQTVNMLASSFNDKVLKDKSKSKEREPMPESDDHEKIISDSVHLMDILKSGINDDFKDSDSDSDRFEDIKVFRFDDNNKWVEDETAETVTSWALNDSLNKWSYAGTLAVISCFIALLIMLIFRNRLRTRKAAVLIVTNTRVKRDCGLVYQQLTEDLAGPKTPIMSKHNLISNITAESNPFQNTKVAPEDV